jgi:hypothetical protein
MKYNHYNIMLLVLRPITIPNKQEIFPIRVRAMVFNATFDYIFIISWWSVLLVEEKYFLLIRDSYRP